MMTQAFYTGVSGIKTHQSAIDITADNIANINTVGFRGYNAEFSSLFEEMLSTTGNSTSVNSSVGMGTRLQATSMTQENGSLILSEHSTDLAISGDGWFGVKSNDDTMYTRAGNFTFDANNDFVTTEGFHVLGTMGNNIDGNSLSKRLDSIALGDVTTQESLRFPNILSYPPEATTNVDFFANLGISNDARVVSASVIDSQGNKNKLHLTFSLSDTQPVEGNKWDVTATAESLDGETIYDTQTGIINFNSSGALLSTTLKSIDNNGSIVNIDLGANYSGVVSTNNPVGTGSSISNGTIGGDLVGYEINKNAEVIATFTNGLQSSVGKIAVYHFQNDRGLDRIDGSKFMQSSNSGDAIFYQDSAGNNILGSDILNYKLENSNVRMEAGLTELIILQRAFDANSKSITTADQLIQKALDMGA